MDCDEESTATMSSTDSPTVETDTVDINSDVGTNAILDHTIANTTAGGHLLEETKNEQSMYCKDVIDSSAVAGSCGLFNLGNTCFMNAGVQSLVSNMDLMEYFLENFQPLRTDMDTLTDRFCHFVRKLWSGRYSIVHPLDFKQQLGIYHPQFRDYRQHDCQEFLAVLLDSLHEQLNVVNRPSQQRLAHESTDPVTSAGKEHIQASDSEENNKKFTSSFKSVGKVKGPSNTVENNLHSNLTSLLECEGEINIPVSLSANAEKIGACGYSQVDSRHSDDLGAIHVHKHSSGNDSPPRMVNSKYKLLSDRVSPSNGACGSEPQIITNLIQNKHTRSRLAEVTTQNNVSANCLRNTKADIIKSDKNFQLNNATLKMKYPEIEQYYAKETKTLNVNMLVMDNSDESITTDSGKFSKRDEIHPLQDDLDIVHEAIPVEASKKDAFDGIKDTNLTTEQRGYSMKNNAVTNHKDLEFDNNPGFNNNIKRMRTDEDEKNIRQQKLSKVNTKKLFDNLTTDVKLFSSRVVEDNLGSMDVASDSDGEVDMESGMSSADEDHDVSSRSSPVLESEVSLHCGDTCSPEDIATADKAWLEYLEQNRSIIVDTFHGQFKSTVICSDCSHVSVTFEPFMYLSLPIPHAMERQICILYLPLNNQPVKYLVTLNKNDMVTVLKQELISLTGSQPGNILMAEVLDCHISRILEDNIMITYINDSSRDIYAFEIKSPPVTNDDEQPTDKTELLNNGAHWTAPTHTVSQGTDLPTSKVTADRNNVFADLTTTTKTDNADTCAMIRSNPSEETMSTLSGDKSCSNNSGGPYDIEETGICSSSTLPCGSTNKATETVTQHSDAVINDNVDDLVAAISELSDDKVEESWQSNAMPGISLGDLARKAPTSESSPTFSNAMPGISLGDLARKAPTSESSPMFSNAMPGISLGDLAQKAPTSESLPTFSNAMPGISLGDLAQKAPTSESSPTFSNAMPGISLGDLAQKAPTSESSPTFSNAMPGISLGDLAQKAPTSESSPTFSNAMPGISLGDLAQKAPTSESSLTFSNAMPGISLGDHAQKAPTSESSPTFSNAMPGISLGDLAQKAPTSESSSTFSNAMPGISLGDLAQKAPTSESSPTFSNAMPSTAGTSDFGQYASSGVHINVDMVGAEVWSWADLSGPDSVTSFWDVPSNATFSKASPTNGIADKWQACAICLEELSDAELMIHVPCGGTFCPSCLEMSMKHYGNSAFTCPVCTADVDPLVDFVPILNAANYKPKLRILSIPVAYRWRKADGDGRMELFGHPNIVYLSSNVTGQQIYDRMDELIPYNGEYTLHLTDGQGLRCSRCQYADHCTGCEIRLDADIHFQPGDQLSVTMMEFTQDLCAHAQDFRMHKSMKNLRSTDPTTLQDCFKTFMKSEFLDEQNLWYCPQCQKNQCAHKTMTVWRYPTTLIIHLKRFVFHDLSSSKVDCKVVFPLESLDLSECLSGPQITDLEYKLQSAICHFGGAIAAILFLYRLPRSSVKMLFWKRKTFTDMNRSVGVNSGHYTAFTQHPVSRLWSNYNDELVSKQIPRELDYSSAYILFYQQQGANVPASLVRRFQHPTSCTADNGRDSQSSMEPDNTSMQPDNASMQPDNASMESDNALKHTVDEHHEDYMLDFYS